MQKVNITEYLPQIMSELPQGILVNTKNGNKTDTMTIGWGQFGIEWGKQIFTIYIRHGRFTHEQLEAAKEFTISVPIEKRSPEIAKAIAYCGTRTGKDIDKFADCNLTIVDGISVKSPAIKEIPLTIECKIIYQQEQDESRIPAVIKDIYYPQDVSSDSPRANQDFHTVYYGEIVNAYII